MIVTMRRLINPAFFALLVFLVWGIVNLHAQGCAYGCGGCPNTESSEDYGDMFCSCPTGSSCIESQPGFERCNRCRSGGPVYCTDYENCSTTYQTTYNVACPCDGVACLSNGTALARGEF